jgi:hypothetical protein
VSGDDLLLVFTNAVDGSEDAFDRWYDDVHVPDVLAVPGVVAARRYALAEMETPAVDDVPAPPPPAHRHLAVYRLDRDPNEVMGDFLERVTTGQMQLDPSLDLSTISLAAWSPRGPEHSTGA